MGLFNKGKDQESKEIAVVEDRSLTVVVDRELVTKHMKAYGYGATLTESEIEICVDQAVMHQLNPFNREIYFVAYGRANTEYRKLSVVTGYEVFISKAEKSGLLDYWDVEEAPPGTPLKDYWCKLTIKRRDHRSEQHWTTYYQEVFQTKRNGDPNQFWAKQPRFMTRKTNIGQGFRLFFQDVMHGIPYEAAELPDLRDPKGRQQDSSGLHGSHVGKA